jgi:hypothetical protein
VVKIENMDKKLNIKDNMKSFKGEMVDDPDSRKLTAAEHDIKRENPYKTPPNNLTSKNRMRAKD